MYFFSNQPVGISLNAYDSMHLSAILVFIAVIALVIFFRRRLRISKYEKLIRYAITIIAIIFEVAFNIWRVRVQGASILAELLPLDLCTISLYLCVALSFTKKRRLFSFVYFYSISAIFSIFFPDIGGFGINHFRYYHYFLNHIYIVFTTVYFISVHKYKINFEDAVRSAGVLILIASTVLIFDYLLNANYMYLMQKPDIVSPLDFFGDWPEYLVGLTMLSIAAIIIVYIPWIFVGKSQQKKQCPSQ